MSSRVPVYWKNGSSTDKTAAAKKCCRFYAKVCMDCGSEMSAFLGPVIGIREWKEKRSRWKRSETDVANMLGFNKEIYRKD
jgi:hypothetical protein